MLFFFFPLVRKEALVCISLTPLFFLFHQLKNLDETRRSLRETPLEENRKKELSSALHVYFKDWLYGRNFQNQSPLKVHVHHVLQGFDCLYVACVK